MTNEPKKAKPSENLKSAFKIIQIASEIIKRENPKATHVIHFFNKKKPEFHTFILPKDNEEVLYKDLVGNLDTVYSESEEKN